MERFWTVPERYGAVGDGRADDTAAVAECVAEAAGRVILLTGRYRHTAPLDLHMRRVHGRMVNGSGLIPDNRAGGFTEAGYAVRVGNGSTGFAKSYLTELQDFWLDMGLAPGIDGLRGVGTVGEHTRMCRVTVSRLRARGEQWVHAMYFEDFVQGLELNSLWLLSVRGAGDFTMGLRLPKGRGATVSNYTVMAAVGIEVEGDGVNLMTGHLEGAGTERAAIGIRIVSRGGGSWQENPDPVVNVSGLNYRGLGGGAVMIVPREAAVSLRGLCKLVGKPGERDEHSPAVVDLGRDPPGWSSSRSIAEYARQNEIVRTTDRALAAGAGTLT